MLPDLTQAMINVLILLKQNKLPSTSDFSPQTLIALAVRGYVVVGKVVLLTDLGKAVARHVGDNVTWTSSGEW